MVKYIGAYMALIGEVDAVVFSGGVGEHSREVRDEVCSGVSHLLNGVEIYTIPTNEELEMARETLKILGVLNDT
jgi:acetate kinase